MICGDAAEHREAIRRFLYESKGPNLGRSGSSSKEGSLVSPSEERLSDRRSG